MSDVPTYVLEREFDAPRELVWKVWTDAELLPRWYGPGVETIVHHLEVKPGGLWLDEMRMGGGSHYERIEYTEVTPPERLIWLHSVCDADWSVTANPMVPDWPRVLLTTVTFDEDGGPHETAIDVGPARSQRRGDRRLRCGDGRPGPWVGRRHGADRGVADRDAGVSQAKREHGLSATRRDVVG